jgi:hypothetical protein
MVSALCSAADNVTVLAVCGRDETARARMGRLGLSERRLRVFGWVDDMPVLVRAADLVITNAGGATALEALATATPVVSADPIAAHGAANADVITVAGLGELCSDLDRLKELVATAAKNPATLEPLRARSAGHEPGQLLEDTVRSLVDGTVPIRAVTRSWPMRAADAFFARVETDSSPQEVGAVLEIDRRPDGTQLTAAQLRQDLQPRTAGLPTLRRVLVRRPLGWRLLSHIDVSAHVEEAVITGECTPDLLWERVSELWAERLPQDRPGWKMMLVRSPYLQHSLLAVKLHHCLGDGISALGLLDRLLNAGDDDPLRERRGYDGHSGARVRPRRLVAGLVSLAARGTAPRHPLNRSTRQASPRLVGCSLPWAEVRRVAKSLDARPHELVVGMVAEVLTTLLDDAGLLLPGTPVRAMVPVAMRLPRLDRIFGNWTGSVALDLPTGPMSPVARVGAVREEMRRRVDRGEPEAGAAVLRVAGQLPEPVHRWFARTVYGRRFFNTIVSYMPAARGPRWVVDAPVRSTVPVLPLVDGLPLTIGIIVADQVAGIGVLLDGALPFSRDAVEAAVRTSFTALGGRLLTGAPGTENG